MQGFMLNSDGDVVIQNGQIQIINGDELLRQTVQSILGTNKGEWFLNIDEGITFSNLLGKEKNEELIRNEILQGLLQVDSSFYIDTFSYEVVGRKLKINFVAKNSNDETVEGVQEWD